MVSNLLFRISPRLHLKACMVYYAFRYGPVSNCINALYFLKLAWKFLLGRLAVIETDEPISNGGYRYFSLTISKLPVSSLHKYDDL